ncbi:hypothetical protein SLS60_007299 [Paraconiothyrium brasiliense]|uniref:Alpha/beta hydrolase n=1 Tax=Paraconiothyrium brasiliense TaxID=300254 RepID=A0ABR3R4Y2_9PLEO
MEKLRFHDGFELQPRSRIAFATVSTNMDSDNYRDPETFDGLRFVGTSQSERSTGRTAAVTVNDKFLSSTILSADTLSIADAVILTGFSMNTSATAINGNGLLRSFVPRIAREENPALHGSLDTGFTESAKQLFTLGEFLTFAGPAGISAEKWDKLALHLTGELDYIVCDGYCLGVFDSPAIELYENAKPVQLSLMEGASHHINFHKNATGAFGVITKFLEDNEL